MSDTFFVFSRCTEAIEAGVSNSRGDNINDISVARAPTRMTSSMDRAQSFNFCAILRSKLGFGAAAELVARMHCGAGVAAGAVDDSHDAFVFGAGKLHVD